MATVTGMTAAAMMAIRDGTIVSAHFDSANHLILTKYDGTTVDGGTITTATTTQAGAVELATNAETQSGSATNLAVTPAGLASLPGYRVQIVSGIAESATPASWPYATSLQSVSAGSGWTPNGGVGMVVTESIDSTRTIQTFYENSGGTFATKAWVREYNSAVGGGGWTAWAQMMLAVRLNEASFAQTTAMSSYPSGRSYLYYTTANGGSWDFTGLAGTVETMYLVDKNYATQTFTQHVSGTTNTPSVWIRTSDNVTGWSGWKKLIHDPGAWTSYTPTWASAGTGTPSLGNATVDCRSIKIGRKVEIRFEITFGSTTNFGNTGTGDNWLFGLPVAAARTGDTIGFVELHGASGSNGVVCMGRARTNTTSNFLISIATPRVDLSAIGNTGDIDAVSPWTWGSTHQIKGNLVYESAS